MSEVNLEVGKCYVDRNGIKYQAMQVIEGRMICYDYEESETGSYALNGLWNETTKEHSPHDIIAEWVEPVVKTVFVSFYSEKDSDKLYISDEKDFYEEKDREMQLKIDADLTNKTASVEVVK